MGERVFRAERRRWPRVLQRAWWSRWSDVGGVTSGGVTAGWPAFKQIYHAVHASDVANGARATKRYTSGDFRVRGSKCQERKRSNQNQQRPTDVAATRGHGIEYAGTADTDCRADQENGSAAARVLLVRDQ